MKKRTLASLLFAIIAAVSSGPAYSEEPKQDYKKTCDTIQTAILLTSQMDQNKAVEEAQLSLVDALASLYRAENKDQKAQYIERVDPRTKLVEDIRKIQNGEMVDFPNFEPTLYWSVIKCKNGTLNFANRCTVFSVTKNDPQYQEISKLVGSLEIGQSTSIPSLPYRMAKVERGIEFNPAQSETAQNTDKQ